jgi:uncharacterized protein (DUF427 family)
MSDRPVRQPGPDHPITIRPAGGLVRAIWRGREVARSDRALELRETTYAPVFYFPREDADMSLLARTSRATWCPYKGEASYFSLIAGDWRDENVLWSYETPIPAMSAIAGMLAFYPAHVTIESG